MNGSLTEYFQEVDLVRTCPIFVCECVVIEINSKSNRLNTWKYLHDKSNFCTESSKIILICAIRSQNQNLTGIFVLKFSNLIRNILKHLLIISLFILPSSFLLGQSYKIEGKVIDDQTGTPLQFANAIILSAADSTLITGATTDLNGKFEVYSKRGIYLLKIQFISYQDRYFNISLSDQNPTASIGTVKLIPNTEILSEIIISGNRSQMQLEIDKRIFNVSEDLNSIASNASEILDNLPSISVDVDGNVNLRGSSNVRILVNGKPSGLVGISSPDALRQLQGNLIERIEVITNPSARYDAEGSAGIINIILKKEQERGINGSFSANTGFPANYGFSGNINYRSGSVNLFGSYGINYRENPGGGFTDRVSRDTLFTYIDNDRLRTGTSHNFRLGADFYVNNDNIISVSGMSRVSDELNTTNITYFDRTLNAGLFNNTLRRDLQNEDDNNTEYQVSYRRIMEGKDHELNVQFQVRDNIETENSSIDSANLLLSTPSQLYQRAINEEGDQNTLMQIDYVRPLGDGKKLETGYRGTLRKITSDYLVEQIDDQGNFFPLVNFSNQFIYNEDVHAFYSIYENKMEKWGYQLGVRFEQTNIKTFQRETGETNNKDYLNAFPSAFLSYKLIGDRTVQASYSRRLSRPRFWYLNPFSSFSDPRNIRMGNTDLNPEYTDSYELGVLNNFKNSSIYFGGYYRYTTGVIERVQTSEDGVNTVSIPRNIGLENAYGLEANFSIDPVKWFNLNGNANFYRAITTGQFNDIVLNRDAYSARFRLNSKFKIGKLDLQLSGNYRAPENRTQGKRKSEYRMDLGASLDVLKQKGTINLSARDLFNTRKYRGSTITDTFTEESQFQWRSRQIRLSFTYRLKQKKNRGSREREEDYGEEGEYN